MLFYIIFIDFYIVFNENISVFFRFWIDPWGPWAHLGGPWAPPGALTRQNLVENLGPWGPGDENLVKSLGPLAWLQSGSTGALLRAVLIRYRGAEWLDT